MSLLRDIYSPKKFNDFRVHKDNVINYKNYVSDNQILNTIFYGPKGSGKYTILMNMLIKIFGEDVLKQKKIKFNINKSCGNSKEYTILESTYHFEINLNKYLFNDRISLVNLISQLIQTKDIYTSTYKIIVIRNLHYLKSDVINFFASVVEKYCDNCRFLMTCSNNTTYINKILKGRFVILKVPSPTKEELFNFSKEILNSYDCSITDSQIDSIINDTNRNLNKLLLYLQFSCENKKYYKYKNTLELYCEQIYKLIKKKKIENLIKIREFAYDLITKNINITAFMIELIEFFNKQDIEEEKKLKILEWGTIFQSRLSKAYKEIIHLEAFIFKIIEILN
jgi:replication factor C subunit 3/5